MIPMIAFINLEKGEGEVIGKFQREIRRVIAKINFEGIIFECSTIMLSTTKIVFVVRSFTIKIETFMVLLYL